VFYGLVSYALPMLMLQSFNQASSEAVRRCVAVDPASATYALDVQGVAHQVISRQLAWMPDALGFNVAGDTRVVVGADKLLTVTIDYPRIGWAGIACAGAAADRRGAQAACTPAGPGEPAAVTGGLFDRWRMAPSPAPELANVPAVGLQLWLDDQARVLRLAGPLRTLLALPGRSAARVHDYLQRHSLLVLEGEPGDWQGQPLDLDFHTVMGQALHTRGWLQRHGEAWLLQLFDIGDLLREQRWDRQRPAGGDWPCAA
jgi:hypothetical protein